MARICAACRELWPSECICPDEDPEATPDDGDAA